MYNGTVTVADLQAAGFKATAGDKFGYVSITKKAANAINAKNSNVLGLGYSVVSLAPRKNTGTQPVGDDCVVEATLADGDTLIQKASELEWGDIYSHQDLEIVTWIPSLKHLENNMNDKQELAMQALPSHDWEQDTCTKCGDKDYLSPDQYCSESKLKNDEWVNGLPPIGIECEYFHEPRGVWVKFIPLLIVSAEQSKNGIAAAYGEWYHPNDCMWEADLVELHREVKFRKLMTPEQVKANEALAWHSYFDTLSIMEISELLVEKGLFAPDEYRNKACKRMNDE